MDSRYIYIICPVRGVDPSEKKFLDDYVRAAESMGHRAHYPPRDIEQDLDKSGIVIMEQHREAMGQCDEVHIYWTEKSEGSRVDFGMAFMTEKPIRLINYHSLKRTSHKSYTNVLMDLHDRYSGQTVDVNR